MNQRRLRSIFTLFAVSGICAAALSCAQPKHSVVPPRDVDAIPSPIEDSPVSRVTGKVLDQHGNQEPYARVARDLVYSPDNAFRFSNRRSSCDLSIADVTGVFVADPDGRREFYAPQVYYATSQDGRRGGYGILTEEHIREQQPVPFEIVVGELGSVRGNFIYEGWEPDSREWSLSAYLDTPAFPSDAFTFSGSIERYDDGDEFELALPAGHYALEVMGASPGAKLVTLSVDVVSGKATMLRDVAIPPTLLGAHYGKAPPTWNVTEARGLPTSTQPSDFKGKWLLIYFWHHR